MKQNNQSQLKISNIPMDKRIFPKFTHLIAWFILKLLTLGVMSPVMAAPNEVPAQPYFYFYETSGTHPWYYDAQEACDAASTPRGPRITNVVGEYVVDEPGKPYVYCESTIAPDENGSYYPYCSDDQASCVIVSASNNYYTRFVLVNSVCPNGYNLQHDLRTCKLISPDSSPKYPAKPSCDDLKGNPIYTAYGNKLQRETDYSGTGNNSLKLERTYNSTFTGNSNLLKFPAANNPLGSMGANWMHTYSRSLKVVNNGILTMMYVYRPDGRLLFFNPSANGWIADADITDKVTEIKDASNVTTGWEYTSGDTEEVETYNANGGLIAITKRNGQTLTLT
jgi:hypothetical protein